MGRRLFDALLSEGRPPRPDVVWPGWTWHREGEFLIGTCGDRRVSGHNLKALTEAIRKAELRGEPDGGGRDGTPSGGAPGVGDRPGF